MGSSNDRLDELLVLRAIQGLSAMERAELDSLLACLPDRETEGFDRAAAAIHIGQLSARGQLPAALRRRIERDARTHFAARSGNASADSRK